MARRRLVVAEAIRAGWEPQAVPSRREIVCEGGCGRAVLHGPKDPTVSYLCPYCRAGIKQWSRARRKEAARKVEESP